MRMYITCRTTTVEELKHVTSTLCYNILSQELTFPLFSRERREAELRQKAELVVTARHGTGRATGLR